MWWQSLDPDPASRLYGDPKYWLLCPVLRICDILVRMRIRIQGSVPLTNRSSSWSCYFHQWLSRRQQKIKNFSKLFCLLLLKLQLHFSKKKSHKEVTKQKSRFFILFLLDDRRIRSTDYRIRKAPKHTRVLRIRIRNAGYVGYLVEARKRTTSAISEGSPMWPRGIWLNNLSIT